MERVKNGKDFPFIISIYDGFVEWAFEMPISTKNSIGEVERKIRRTLRCYKGREAIRTKYPAKLKINFPSNKKGGG